MQRIPKTECALQNQSTSHPDDDYADNIDHRGAELVKALDSKLHSFWWIFERAAHCSCPHARHDEMKPSVLRQLNTVSSIRLTSYNASVNSDVCKLNQICDVTDIPKLTSPYLRLGESVAEL